MKPLGIALMILGVIVLGYAAMRRLGATVWSSEAGLVGAAAPPSVPFWVFALLAAALIGGGVYLWRRL